MDNRIDNLIDECKRQEESCLYTSATLFEWLKSMRRWRVFFVVGPIVLGGIATWPLLTRHSDYEWLTAVCALLAGLAPAVYKALDFDVSLGLIAKQAHEFKVLQDRFRQAWRVSAQNGVERLQSEFEELMKRMDAARSASLTAPERFFKSAQAKITAGHYDFTVDTKEKSNG